ncbi:MAG: hypothetical protein WC817_02900 [Patescibacteria group bacterium]|jgi:hypothetical protein
MRRYIAGLTIIMLLALSVGYTVMPMDMDDMVMDKMAATGSVIMSAVHCSMDGCLTESSATVPSVSCLEHCLAAGSKALPNSLPMTERTIGISLIFGLAAAFAFVKPRTKKLQQRLLAFQELFRLQQLSTVVLRD